MSESDENEGKCPYQKIVKFDGKSSKFLVKLCGKKGEQILLTEEEICKYPEGKNLLARFSRQKNDGNDLRSYDASSDKIDLILMQNEDKYLVLKNSYEFDDITWETEVDRKQLNLFQKREQYEFPNKNDDVFAPPKSKLSVDYLNYKSLAPSELITLKKLIYCFNSRKDFLIKENMGIDTMNACITFLRILQTEGNEHGPYLIVSDKKWYDKLLERSEMLTIYYGGNDDSIEKINELYFQDDNQTPHFHCLVVSPQNFKHYIQYISKIHYRVAIFHSYKAQLIYKKYQSLKVAMSACINVLDPSQSSKQIDVLSSVIISCKKELNSDELRRTQDINNKIQPSLQRKQRHGDSQFISPPIISIDSPLSEIQKKLCRSVLTEYAQKPRTAIEKVLRICSHAYLCFNGEYDLCSPSLIESSTKLKILNRILDRHKNQDSTTLIISQYQQMINYIIDLLDEKQLSYVQLSSDAESSPDTPPIYLYNPKYKKAMPPIQYINCVVIFDGGTAVWNDMLQEHRTNRTPLFNVTNVYHLECRGCCERDLLALSELSTLIKSKADAVLHTVAIHAFSDFMIPSVDNLISSGIPDDKAEPAPPIAQYIYQCDYTPILNGEIIHGQPPEEIPTHSEENSNANQGQNDYSEEGNDNENNVDESGDYSYVWSIHERNLLTRGLFSIGLNRLEALQKVVGLYLPKTEIDKMIPPILAYLLKASNGYNIIRGYVKEINEKHPIKSITEIPTFNDEYYLGVLHEKASALLRRLENLYHLNNLLGGDGRETDVKEDQVPFFRFGGGNLTEWWSEKHDKALAYITWRFGYGCFDHYEEYAETNEFCRLFVNLPEFIEYKRFADRSQKLCEVAKRMSVTDQKVIETLSKRPSKSQLPTEVQAKIIHYLLKYGIFEDESGGRDYDFFAGQIQYQGLDGKELANYVEDLLKLCNNPTNENGIPTSMAQRVLSRVEAMSQLRKLLRNKEQFLKKIVDAKHRRNLGRKWTPEIERSYFEKVEKRGFGDLQSIFKDPELIDVFDAPPSVLLTEDDVVKRINDIYKNADKSPSLSSQRRNQNSPNSNFSPSTGSSRKSSSSSSTKKKSSKPPSQSSNKKLIVNRLKELKKGVNFPFQVTQVSQILDLGHIITDRPGFHNERYIFPAGYKATRQFADLKHPSERITWISEIVDSGGETPKFRIYPEGRPDEYMEGETPSSPWVTALKTLSSIRGEKGKANTISGPEAYLLSHPTTIYLIQHMPGASECSNYIMKPIMGEDNDDNDDE